MALALYEAITAPVENEPPQYRIGYDTRTGAIHVVIRNGGSPIAYLPPRESREMAENILRVGKTDGT